MPFLFTQSEAILARTWIPLQDSPGLKFTYEARIHTPEGYMALMSAENDTTLHSDGIYTFKMTKPVSSYLMALSVGDIRYHSWDATPGCTPSRQCWTVAYTSWPICSKWWTLPRHYMVLMRRGRYDVLVLPPSFPWWYGKPPPYVCNTYYYCR